MLDRRCSKNRPTPRLEASAATGDDEIHAALTTRHTRCAKIPGKHAGRHSHYYVRPPDADAARDQALAAVSFARMRNYVAKRSQQVRRSPSPARAEK